MSTTSDEVPAALLRECRTELERLHTVLRDEPGRFAADRLARVELALHWLAAGSYGRCGICRRRLDDARLRESPEHLVCASCAHPHASDDEAASAAS